MSKMENTVIPVKNIARALKMDLIRELIPEKSKINLDTKKNYTTNAKIEYHVESVCEDVIMGYIDELEDGELFPFEAGKLQFSDVDYLDTWKEMENLVNKGLAKSIGVSNFSSDQLERLLKNCKIMPVNNQVECHPYLNQKKLIEFCKSKNIAITAYSPLGSPDRPWAKPEDPLLLEDSKLKAIAEKYKKSAAQVVLRYQVQRGNITIPKSVTKARIQQNIEIFDFELSKEDMDHLDTFDCNGRICALSDAVTHKYYPFIKM